MNDIDKKLAMMKDWFIDDITKGTDHYDFLDPIYFIDVLEKMSTSHKGLENKMTFHQNRLDTEIRCNVQKMEADQKLMKTLESKIIEHDEFILKATDAVSDQLLMEKEKNLLLVKEMQIMRARNDEMNLKCEKAQKDVAHLKYRFDKELMSVVTQLDNDHQAMESLTEGMKTFAEKVDIHKNLLSEVQMLRRLVDKYVNPEFQIEITVDDAKKDTEEELPEDEAEDGAEALPSASRSAWRKAWRKLNRKDGDAQVFV